MNCLSVNYVSDASIIKRVHSLFSFYFHQHHPYEVNFCISVQLYFIYEMVVDSQVTHLNESSMSALLIM